MTGQITSINGLRAVAVLSVVLYHFDEHWLPGGYTGVDVFFVISGYVIARSLVRSPPAGLGRFLARFYRRRVLRILPALIVCVIATEFAATLFIPDIWLSEHNDRTGLWSLFGLSNLALLKSADGYFALRIPFNPFAHTWSLAVEEQFYVLFPLLFFAWVHTARTRGPKRTVAVWILPLLCLASLIWAMVETAAHPARAFFMLPSRFWELAAGAMVFQAQHSRLIDIKSRIGAAVLLWCGSAVLALGFIFSDPGSFPFPWALAPVIGTVMLIAGLTTQDVKRHPITRAFELRLVVYIGLISYSLYLWHWPVFVLFRWTVGMAEFFTSLIALVLAFVLAAVSFHLVENPIRYSQSFKSFGNARIILTGLAAIILVAGVIRFQQEKDTAWGVQLTVTADTCVWDHLAPETCADPLPPLDTTAGQGRTVFLLGDSHAYHYTSMVRDAARRLGAGYEVMSSQGCPIANLQYTGDSVLCGEEINARLDRIEARAKPGDIVFLAALRVPRLIEQFQIFDEAEILQNMKSPEAKAQFEAALKEALAITDRLTGLGLQVVMDAPKPVFRAPPIRCSDWFNRSNPICAAGFTVPALMQKELSADVRASLGTLGNAKNVHIWDPFPVLCPGETCSAFDGDLPLFVDGDHLSGHGNRVLVDDFSRFLAEVWQSP